MEPIFIFMLFLLLLVVIFLFIFWLRQFLELMGRSDNSFPGKYDKIIWVVVLLLFGVIGAFIYLFYNLQKENIQTIEVEKPQNEYPQPCLECGKTIPAESTKCPSCGWSYQN